MMKSEDGLLLIAKSMYPDNPTMMTDVVILMTALCLVEYVIMLFFITIFIFCLKFNKKLLYCCPLLTIYTVYVVNFLVAECFRQIRNGMPPIDQFTSCRAKIAQILHVISKRKQCLKQGGHIAPMWPNL